MTTLHFDPEMLRLDFLNTANFRRERAVRYPKDSRNAEAAERLEKLAETVDAVETPILDAYGELFEDCIDGDSELLRQIGFHIWPSTATEFVQALIASQTAP